VELADIAECEVSREARKENTMREEVRKSGLRSARQNEKKAGGESQNAERHQRGKQRQARVEAFQSAARRGRGAIHRAANLRARQGRNCEEQVQSEEQEEIEIDGQDGGRQQFQERNGCSIEIIAIGPGGKNFHHREKKQQVDRGCQEIARES